jgi:hypothetical protein
MIERLYAFRRWAMALCVASSLAGAQCVADDAAGPALSQPRVNPDAELAAPPLLLPATSQDEVTPTFAVEPPAKSEVSSTPVIPPAPVIAEDTASSSQDTRTVDSSTSMNVPHHSHEVEMHVEAEVITPPAPVVVAPTQAAYEPIYRELPVTNHIMHIGARHFARCQRGMMHAKLEVTNPAECDGCCYWVSAQVPACCAGEPIRAGRVGILGRGVVEYRWSCGWTVKVVFRTRGDVVIHYMAG